MQERARAPWHLWLVGAVTLLWNAIGVFSYLMTQTGNLVGLGMTPEQIAYFDAFPVWATAVWALGVWGAFAGSILILLRRRWAVVAFGMAIVGLVGTTIFELLLSDVPEGLSNPALLTGIWFTTVGSLFYARWMARAGVLR